VDNVAQVNASNYWRLDIGVSWQVTPNFEVSLWGQNLLEPRHHEFSAYETERGAYVMGTVRF
jgi:outer membrane receptor for monomeric catechols